MKLLSSILILMLYITPVKADNLSCLAEAVYFEARSESFVAQLAVAYVLPYWALDERFSIVGQIDNHVFYIDNSN